MLLKTLCRSAATRLIHSFYRNWEDLAMMGIQMVDAQLFRGPRRFALHCG